jgi:hypothetical protein
LGICIQENKKKIVLLKLEDKRVMIFGTIDCSTLGASSILGQFSQLITCSVARFGSWLKPFL